ncbi:hypothetical protein HCN44_001119 [Aphidius gifuensis]|uniref:F-box/LRR-repeat protein 15-like leucin rich repeat domain-containing protein n=1 Tax=Aphidius gifuensis TaxID=684658 RepID=A0A834XPL5_APHGI|nr:hypothetical protein HCN44_001119 [Aphidius gifuensis]
MSKFCKICDTSSGELTSIYTTINGKILERSGLMHMIELYINKNISDNIVSPPPLICNFCIYKISEEFVVKYKQKNDKKNNQPVVSSTVLPSGDNNGIEKKKIILNDEEDFEMPDDDLFLDEIDLNIPEVKEQVNKITETNDDCEIIKVKENIPQSSVEKKKLKSNKTKSQSIEKHFIKIDKTDKPVLNEKNQNIDKLKDENVKSVESNKYKKINNTPATSIDDENIKCKKIKEEIPEVIEKNKEHKNIDNDELLSPSKSKDNVKIKKENSIDDLKVENGKSKSYKSRDDKVRSYRSKDDKSKEEKTKDDKTKNYKSKDDKTKEEKSKDNDKSKDDSPSSSSTSKKRDLKRQRSAETIKKTPTDEDSKLNNNEDSSSGSGRRRLKRLCQRDVKEIKAITIDDDQDHTLKININCLSKIFRYLSILELYKIENVCPRWKEASKLNWKCVNSLNSNELKISRDDKSFSCTEDAVKKIIVKCGNYLNDITLSYLSGPLMIQTISKYCQNLLHLKLDNLYAIRGSMDKNLANIGKLETIRLQEFTISDRDPSKTYNQILLGLQRNIKAIHLIPNSSYSIVLSNEFTQTLEQFNKLECLTLRSCQLNAEAIDTIIAKKNLIYLDLGECEFSVSIASISTLKNLEHLNISQAKNIDNDAVNEIINTCIKLKHLNLVGCTTILPLTIMNISKLHELEHLNLENLLNVDSQSIENIANNCKKLNYLNLKSCKNVADYAISKLSKLNNLEYLNINYLFNINTQSLSEITNKCRKLKYLDIEFCSNVSESGLKDIGKLTYIEHLNLGRVKNITDNVIQKITRKCWRLKYLNINECNKRVTSSMLNDIRHLKYLEELVIDNVVNATDEMFLKIYHLRVLSCVGCTSITDTSIKNILKNCSKIENLNINKTGVTVDSLVRAVKEINYRKNNIPLKIQVNSSVYKDFDDIKYKCNELLSIFPIN